MTTTAQEFYAVIAMNARNQITQERIGGAGAVVTTRSYDDAMARLKTIGSTFNGATVQTLSYNYDSVGNLNWRNDQSSGKNVQEVLVYDELNRLTTSTVSGTGLSTSTTSVAYDGYGNLKNKGGIAYGYGGNGGPHAATTVGSTTYIYDANGNNTSSSDGRAITYSTFDKPLTMTMGSYSGQFSYDPSRNLYKRLDTSAGSTTKLITVGNTEFVTQPNGNVDVRRYLPGGIQRTTTYSNGTPGATATRYFLKDNIGSLDVILTSTGTVEQALSFDAWGLRRTTTNGASLWSPLNTASLTAFDHSKTTKGFTGHEMIDEVGIIHMGGRIYDPRIGRFLQADPTLQLPTNTQNYNRYSYVINNPLTYTDPTGYNIFGSRLGHLFDNVGETTVNAIPTAFAIVACIGASSWSAGAAAGACIGAMSVNAVATGQDWKSFLMSVAMFAFSATNGASWNPAGFGVEDFVGYGVIGGIGSLLQGQNFGNGFLSAGVGAWAGSTFGGPGASLSSKVVGVAIAGTISQLTGGKFANGAITAAFAAAVGEAANQSVDVNSKYVTEKKIKSALGRDGVQDAANVSAAAQQSSEYFTAHPDALPADLVGKNIEVVYVHARGPNSAGALQHWAAMSVLQSVKTIFGTHDKKVYTGLQGPTDGQIHVYAGSGGSVDDALKVILHEYGHHTPQAMAAGLDALNAGQNINSDTVEGISDKYARDTFNVIRGQ